MIWHRSRSGSPAFAFDLGSRIRAWIDGQSVQLLAVDRALGPGRSLLQPGRAANAAAAPGGDPRGARPGFLLLGVVVLVTSLLFQISPAEHLESIRSVIGLAHFPLSVFLKFADAVHSEKTGDYLRIAYQNLIFINLMWGLLNLLPLWPLDGGQATQILLTFVDRSRGPRWGHVVSLLVAGGLAILVMASDQRHVPHDILRLFCRRQLSGPAVTSPGDSKGLYQDDDWWRR